MSAIIEVYYPAPANQRREKAVEDCAAARGGRLTYREEEALRVTLTLEFEGREDAGAVMRDLAAAGWHVEGPSDY